MPDLTVGQRVRLARLRPAFGSAVGALEIFDRSGDEGVRQVQEGFEQTLKEVGVQIGSEGTLLAIYEHGWADVNFDGALVETLGVPIGLLDPV